MGEGPGFGPRPLDRSGTQLPEHLGGLRRSCPGPGVGVAATPNTNEMGEDTWLDLAASSLHRSVTQSVRPVIKSDSMILAVSHRRDMFLRSFVQSSPGSIWRLTRTGGCPTDLLVLRRLARTKVLSNSVPCTFVLRTPVLRTYGREQVNGADPVDVLHTARLGRVSRSLGRSSLKSIRFSTAVDQ